VLHADPPPGAGSRVPGIQVAVSKLSQHTQQRIQAGVREVVTTMSPASVGIELALAVLLGLGVGYWIDAKLGSFPGFTLLFLGFGITAGFKAVWREAKRAMPDAPPAEPGAADGGER